VANRLRRVGPSIAGFMLTCSVNTPPRRVRPSDPDPVTGPVSGWTRDKCRELMLADIVTVHPVSCGADRDAE
jgi:hypothetical protein